MYINLVAKKIDTYHSLLDFFIELPYKHLGCFKDAIPRALESLELELEDHYKRRTDAIKKCYDAAIKLRYKFFAVQDGGQCFSGKTATVTFSLENSSKTTTITYEKYGKSSDCVSGGKGGPMANDVYKIKTGKFKVSRFINSFTSY